MARQAWRGARRVVVKVGSALLVEGDAAFERFARQVCALWDRGVEVVVVSSGAIALGWGPLGLSARPKDLPSLQAAAAIGQGRLMGHWTAAMARHGRSVAQVLLTHADVQDRRRYLNARNALERLLVGGVVPVINENDTVAVEEIRFGDNDNLAADVVGLVGGDLVVLLTSVDGLYTADPNVDPAATRLSTVDSLTDRVRSMAGAASQHGTGGMRSKLQAAERAAVHGASTVIASGLAGDALERLARGEDVGTLIVAPDVPRAAARKRWIGTALRAVGVLQVDDGAAAALIRGASLLPAGVRSVSGTFDVGDPVDVVRVDGERVGRGLVAMHVDDARAIAGLKTAQAREVLGVPSVEELIHRDDFVVLQGGGA